MASGPEPVFRLTDLRVTRIYCHRCAETFPRPNLPLTVFVLRCPRCGNLMGNKSGFTIRRS